MQWNLDLTRCPRGHYDVVPAGPDKTGARKVFKADEVIIATKCGVVTVSYYIPDEKRWNMLAQGEQPIAWMPITGMATEVVDGKERQVLPKHPTVGESWFSAFLHERRAAA